MDKVVEKQWGSVKEDKPMYSKQLVILTWSKKSKVLFKLNVMALEGVKGIRYGPKISNFEIKLIKMFLIFLNTIIIQ